ncbi:MAG: hypothetical protein ABWX84_16400 [Nocardioides sp.]|jgi:hypothetical protein
MSRSSVSTLALTMSAACLATLLTACGADGGQGEPISEADEVATSAHRYATGDRGEVDPAQRRYLARYFSDRAMSDAWQRHPELIGRAR